MIEKDKINNPVLVLNDYTVKQYTSDIDKYGLTFVWEAILNTLKSVDDQYGIVSVPNLGELYEIGLAHVNKVDKKEHGKYYTPDDVANVMSDWFVNLKGKKVCDVCCGTGNLILSYLNKLKTNQVRKLILDGNLYLYDMDELALKICKSIIGLTYGKDVEPYINCVLGDFLSKNITLPENCKAISNPPYFRIKNIDDNWNITDVIRDSKEFYSAIMEKIIDQSKASVIITPYSFIGSDKFYSLRKKMNNHNGFIVSFDNVPGNIFIGRKHGIFNSNSTNSVRAAITVVENKAKCKGFKCSHLIRFKNEEREELLNAQTLLDYVGSTYQLVDDNNKKYVKCHSELESIWEKWNTKANNKTVKNLFAQTGKYQIVMPNTCRYYSVAATKDLDRTGKYYLKFDDENKWAYAYCFINSSFCYWYWRLFDGGITFTQSLLNSMPSIYETLSNADKKEFLEIAKEMQQIECKHLSYKKNAGTLQENIKFPSKYKEKINNLILRLIGETQYSSDVFNLVHTNTAFLTGKMGGEIR